MNCFVVSHSRPQSHHHVSALLVHTLVRSHIKMRVLLDRFADVTALDFGSFKLQHRACASDVDADAKVECSL